MWLAHEAANRPWPVLDEDPVIDFKIMEAVAVRVQRTKQKAREEAEKRQWRKDTSDLEDFR